MNRGQVLRILGILVIGAALFSARLAAQLGLGPFGGGSKPPKPRVDADNGIYVGDPKVYDNAALETLLYTTQQKLASFSGYDQSSLTNQLGKTQGASIDQSQSSLQLNVSPKPSAPAPPTSQNSQPFTLPSFAPSSADILSEQTQLNFQLTSLQLLLQGALSDKFLEGTTIGKTHTTLGFPISITVPPGFKYREAVAEVEISVCLPPGYYDPILSSSLSLVNLIPQEKTYNVAGIVNSTSSISGGAVAGIVSAGGSLLRGHQTYYVVKDQDTLAVTRAAGKQVCRNQTVQMASSEPTSRDPHPPIYAKVGTDASTRYDALRFAWQFRPVLGQKVVRDGTRQTFAQIALPPPLGVPFACPATLYIDSKWKRFDLKSGRVGNIIPGTARRVEGRFFTYDRPPAPRFLIGEDNGDGTVTVTVTGTFKPGTMLRIGNQIIASSTGLGSTDLRFTAQGSALALYGGHLVDGDGLESSLTSAPQSEIVCQMAPEPPDVTAKEDSRASASSKKKAARKPVAEAEHGPQSVEAPHGAPGDVVPTPAVSPIPPSSDQPVDQQSPVAAAYMRTKVEPLTDTTSILTLGLTPADTNLMLGDPLGAYGEIPVVLIGGQVFGLRNSPFLELKSDHVTFVVTNDLLRANRKATWKRLFSSAALPRDISLPAQFVLAGSAITLLGSGLPDPTQKAAPDASAKDKPATDKTETGNASTISEYAITGQHLKGLKIIGPPEATKNQPQGGETELTFSLPDSVASKLKYIVVQQGMQAPIVLALPAPPAAPGSTSTTAKNSIDAQKTGIASTAKSIDLTGTGMSQVTAVTYYGTQLTFTSTTDKKLTLNFQPVTGPALTLSPPGITVVFQYADKSLIPYDIPVQPASTK